MKTLARSIIIIFLLSTLPIFGNAQENGFILSVSNNVVREGTSTFEFVITRTGENKSNTFVSLLTINEDAMSGSDFQHLNKDIDFEAGETQKVEILTLHNDKYFEATESLYINLSWVDANGAPRATSIQVFIEDNDQGFIVPLTLREGEEKLVITKQGDFETNITLTVHLWGAIQSTNVITVQPGQTLVEIPITNPENDLVEMDKYFDIEITSDLKLFENYEDTWSYYAGALLQNNDLNPLREGPVELSEPMNYIYDVFPLSDGKILIDALTGAGSWTYAFAPVRQIIRLLPCGEIDTTFAPRSISGGIAIWELPDKKILVNGTSTYRLHSNGDMDESFPLQIGNAAIEPNGSIIIASGYDIKRILQNGATDTNFIVVLPYSVHGYPLVTTNGDIYINTSGHPIKVKSSGEIDPDFNPAPYYKVIRVTGDSVLAVDNTNLVKLTSTGSVSQDFHPIPGNYWTEPLIDSHGRLYLYSSSLNYSGATFLRRFHANGEEDQDFSMQSISLSRTSEYSFGSLEGAFHLRNDDELIWHGFQEGLNGEANVCLKSFLINPQGVIIVPQAPVWETNGRVKLYLIRSGSSAMEQTYSYRLIDGTARAGIDYTASTGTVTFPQSSSIGEISLLLHDNRIIEEDRHLFLEFTSEPGQIPAPRAKLEIMNSNKGMLARRSSASPNLPLFIITGFRKPPQFIFFGPAVDRIYGWFEPFAFGRVLIPNPAYPRMFFKMLPH